jgi:hypothetical protein
MTQETNHIECANFKCPIRRSCKRYTTPADGDPTVLKVFVFETKNGETHCDNFICNKNLIYATDREIHSRS